VVNRIVLLDAGPLGLVSNPGRSQAAKACNRWLRRLISTETIVAIPEIADYEVRRELLRADKSAGLARLDELLDVLDDWPITTAVMRRAAELWAETRRAGEPTASPDALDADVILAAFGQSSAAEVVVATTNVGHLGRFVAAMEWIDIQP